MTPPKRAKWMLGVVAVGLFLSGVTVWPAISELQLIVDFVWGQSESSNMLYAFLLKTIDGLQSVKSGYPFLLYAHDWLAFAHVMLAILFAGAIRDPVRNKWVIQCGLIMCAIVPIWAGICIPIRRLPLFWFWIDFSFAPAAAIPLFIALRDVRRLESKQATNRTGGAIETS